MFVTHKVLYYVIRLRFNNVTQLTHRLLAESALVISQHNQVSSQNQSFVSMLFRFLLLL